jgi:aspartate carbamoyltransferase regulatory subunit
LQFMKENFNMMQMVGKKLENSSVNQYKIEERSYIAKRMISSPDRIHHIIRCMKQDTISFPKHVERLKQDLIDYVGDVEFKKCQNMGEILETILIFVKRNYLDISSK